VSGPEVQLAAAPMDIVEIAALRAGAGGLRAVARERGLELPRPGGVAVGRQTLALCVRPERWLILSPSAAPAVTHSAWQRAAAGLAAAVDLSSGLVALHLAGPAAAEVLVRGCSLDLAGDPFPAGGAAATIMAQLSVVLAAVSPGWLLLTPATTARHLREWLTATGKPFGLIERGEINVFDAWGG
jgi:heterotetrameric sarcosine oxidase gamma subunit